MKVLVQDFTPTGNFLVRRSDTACLPYRVIEISDEDIELIEKIKPKHISVVTYVKQFFADESRDLADLLEFINKQREHV